MAERSNSAAPKVRLELRTGGGRPAIHELSGSEFLVGSVPGCDLRLAGSNLPPLVCVVTIHADGVHARKLAPTLPLLHNGQPFVSALLESGDLITLGPMTILVAIEPGGIAIHRPTEIRFEPIALNPIALDSTPEPPPVPGAPVHVDTPEPLDLAAQKRELDQRYQAKRDRLAALQQAVDTAARNLQTSKRALETERAGVVQQKKSLETQKADLETRERRVTDAQEKLVRAKLALDEETQQLEDKRNDLTERERSLAGREEQYRADLTRLDRLQGTLEQRERQLEARQAECERRSLEHQQQVHDIAERAKQIDTALARQREQAEQLFKTKVELDERRQQVDERARTIDGQQSMLAALRSRIERTRDEVRKEAGLLVEQRARHEAAERALEERQQQMAVKLSSIDTEHTSHTEARRQFDERSAAMNAAVAQMRQLQDRLTTEAEAQRIRGEDLDRQAAELAEQTEQVKQRAAQVVALQEQLYAERLTLHERGATIGQSDETRSALQEQLLRRSEELAAREKEIEAASQAHAATVAEFKRYHEAFDTVRRDVESQFSAVRTELELKSTEIEKLSTKIAEREETLRRHVEKLRTVGAAVAAERKAQHLERSNWMAEQHTLVAEIDALQTELEAYRRKTSQESAFLSEQLPELELRGEAVLARLAQAREELHGHLAELHDYTRQSQQDLQALRTHVSAEFERMRAEELSLQRERADHRLAVAGFRQQLLEWQSRIADMRQSLAHDGTRLEWKQAEVESAAQQIDATSQQLAEQTVELAVQERQVAAQRGEVERHLGDMRDWYRQKLRELAESGTGSRVSGLAFESSEASIPLSASADSAKPETRNPEPDSRDVLSWQDDLDPSDRQLGDLLKSLGLVDDATLTALLLESRRQRRSLRQVLLAGRENGSPILTLYQMALIEAGNLDGLVLGPLRVIDRLGITPHESTYRVFDPRRNSPALLRHLTDAEIQAIGHADEYRQRFSSLTKFEHDNLVQTLDVLEINGRPAVIQEWLPGLPSSEWPAAAAVPGVWYRLMMQCALGMRAAHDAGLTHGCRTARSVLLTRLGVIKLAGFGEPAWLTNSESADSVAGDLAGLGQIAAGWAALAPRRRGNKPPKPLPAQFLNVLNRLQPSSSNPFVSAADLLDALDNAGVRLADSSDAWDALLEHVVETGAEPLATRKSA